MATYMQLESEPWWGREIITQAMTGAGLMLRTAYGVGATSFGTKGNNAHLSGAHRSQEWIKNSDYCTSRTYTVQSGLTTTQARFIAGMDFTPGSWGTADNRAKMIAITRRLDKAARAGDLNGIVRQFFGTLNGSTVYGLDIPTMRIISADDSHLDHEHVGVDRRVADNNDAMAKIAHIMIGDDLVTTPDEFLALLNDAEVKAYFKAVGWQYSGGGTPGGKSSMLMSMNDIYAGATRVDEVEAKLDALNGKFDQLLAALAGAPGGTHVPMSITLSGTVSGSVSASGTATPIATPPGASS